MEDYSGLNRAQLSYDYLHTNSTTHEFLFGAIAELIDNSRDANATELEIFTTRDNQLRGGFMICIGDNGDGMTPEDAKNVVIFGKSVKKNSEGSSIGMYGNGLKSGSMRIGNDMIIFTKKDGVYSCLFLSRTFHENEKLEEIIVPLPSFSVTDKSPLYLNEEDRKKHEIEMQIIFKHSPFKNLQAIFAQFNKLKDKSGTLIIIYNMKLLDNGLPELDIISDPKDILLTGCEEKGIDIDADIDLPPEKRSLRAYVSILYSNPRMKVYIQGRKVQTKQLLASLYNTRRYNYASSTFKTRAETDLNKAKSDLRVAELRTKEADSKVKDYELRIGSAPDPDQLKQLRRYQMNASEAKQLVLYRQNTVNRKQKAIREPKTLTFYFGLNVVNRAQDGMFVYNCSRLIKMYQRIGPQNDSTSVCRGVVGIVDVPYMVLEPTHNKQDFADAKEYRFLMRTMADHLMQYWDDIGIETCSVETSGLGHPEDSLIRFWKSFGYMSARWRDPPSQDQKFIKKRLFCIKLQVQCDKCLKWRTLPFSQSQLNKDLPDKWQCKDNTDPKHRSCENPEEDTSPPIGMLKRKIKTKEQRQAELEAHIKKKQAELEKIRLPEDIASDSESSVPSVKLKKRETVSKRKKPISSEDEDQEEENNEKDDNKKDKSIIHKIRSAPPPPSKKPNTHPQRAMTVADKKRFEQKQQLNSTPVISPKKKNIFKKSTPEIKSSPKSLSRLKSKNSKKTEIIKIKDSEIQKNEEKLEEKEEDIKVLKSSPKTIHSENNGCIKDENYSSLLNGENLEKSNQPKIINVQGQITSINEIIQKKDPIYESIEQNFKAILTFFMPPSWDYDKTAIQTLTKNQLAEFPHERFCQAYEKSFSNMITKYQAKEENSKLVINKYRTLAAKLILDKTNTDVSTLSQLAIDSKFDEYVHSEIFKGAESVSKI